VELADGSQAIVRGHFGEIENFKVTVAGKHHKKGDVITEDLMHQYQHAVVAGNIENGVITLHDGSKATITKAADSHFEMIIKKDGKKHKVGDKLEGDKACKQYYEVINSGVANKVIYGANLKQNEYGPQQYAQFFFFITGFHGFHVFSGVVINIIICLGAVAGTYHKRGHYEMVEKTGLYWHFVDLVWVFVFTFFYLV
jgi:cytochrome c oxidase subunit 3